MQQSDRLILTVLRHARDEQQARLAEIEDTVAWQVGGLLIAMLQSPLRCGPVSVVRLMRLFLGARRGRSPSTRREISRPALSPHGMKADYLVYGKLAAELPGTVWQTEDAGRLLACLEKRESPGCWFFDASTCSWFDHWLGFRRRAGGWSGGRRKTSVRGIWFVTCRDWRIKSGAGLAHERAVRLSLRHRWRGFHAVLAATEGFAVGGDRL